MSVHPPQTLSDACAFIVDCLHTTAPPQGDGYPLIRTPNIGKGRLDLADVHRVSEETYQSRTKRAVPEPGDLILAREAPAGNVAVVREGEKVCLGQRTVHLRPNRAKVDPEFLCYFLLAPLQQGKLLAGETGATAQHVNMKDIRKLELTGLPSLPVQQAIGSLLAAYDDLIENNRRRLALLEEAARQLYREWFVRLRFPGYEHTRITNGVPAGWERRSISAIADCIGGGTPSTMVSAYWEDGDVTWVTPTDVTRNKHFVLLDSEKKITEAGLKNSSAKLVPSHAVLMTSRASVGFFAIAGREVCTNQGFISIAPQEPALSSYLLFHLSERVEEIRSMGSGSTYPEVSRGKFREFDILLPKQSLVLAFDELATQLLAQIRVLKQLNVKLRAARDLLLPRLMSGEIPV